MADAKPAVAIHPGRHVTWYGNDTQRARAMAILTALLGAYGRKGGIFLPTKMAQGRIPLPPMPDSEKPRADRIGDAYPLATEESQGLTHGLIEATLDRQSLSDQGMDCLRAEHSGKHSDSAEDTGSD